jgi:UDP-N-acetylglucosamine transferase subunit ALG13
MIFVTVGTNEAPFDRLLLALDGIGADEELIVQHGSSSVRPAGARCLELVAYEELVELVQRARIVVGHAGVGSVLTALANGKRPVVVPRLHRFGEAVDDHQLLFAQRLEQAGLVALVEDPGRLAEALHGQPQPASIRLEADRRLVEDLRAYVLQGLERRAVRRSLEDAA